MATEAPNDNDLASEPYLSTLDMMLLLAIAVATAWWFWKNYLKKEEASPSRSYTLV
jgi:hypothetical protein